MSVAPRQLQAFDFEQAPMIVIWEATRACDLVCRHCRAEAQPDAHPDQLDDPSVRRMISRIAEAFGPCLFVITGGDPLKRPNLLKHITFAAECGLQVGITPSATPLLTETAVCDLQTAGTRRFAVSLDGADAETHDRFRGVAGTFARSLARLHQARRLGLSTQINTTVGPHNIDQLSSIAQIAGFLDISLWSVFQVVPTGRAGVDLVRTAGEHERTYRELAAIALDPGTRFGIKTTAGQPYYRVLEQERRRRGLSAQPRRGLGVNDGKGFCFIDHTGAICPSGFLPTPCGNVQTHDLAEIYRQHPLFRALRRPEGYRGKCGRCPFNAICGGSRSRAHALTGDALGSDPTCPYQPPMAT